MNKIKDNPSYAKMRNDIEGTDALKKVLKIANVFGVNVGDTLESLGNLSELRTEFEKLSSMPDRFNEPITLPYRNGILHGRDLGYANKEIAAKCWATLFAVYDWAIAIKQGKKTPPSEEHPKTLKETLADIRDTQKQIVKNRIIKDKIEEWQPRSITVGIDIPESTPSNEYANNSPEQEAVRFMEYWQVQNYGFIAKQLYLPLQHKNYGKEAKRIRDIFEDKKLIRFK